MEKQSKKFQVEQAWAKSIEDIINSLDIDPGKGLSEKDVKKRQEIFGKNRLQTEEERSILQIALEQFKSLIILLLAVSAVISLFFGDYVEALAIGAVILINAAIGFFTELQAVRSMEALRELTQIKSKVRREGEVIEVNAREIVPGDILVLNGGDIITADARIIQASKLRINEAALTGESLPVEKQTDPLPEDTSLAERRNMVFKGTAISRGSAEGIVVTTGMETELGNISSLVLEAEEEVTPLQKRLDELGKNLIWVTLALAVIVTIAGWVSGRELRLMVETAIALAVASIPEGLPIVATIALARGMQRMAEHNALVNKLSSVETLGATSIIITDKTGTLTESQMTVTEIELEAGSVEVSGEGLELDGEFRWYEESQKEENLTILEDLLKVGVLCNDSSLSVNDGKVEQTIGEPMEIALIILGRKADYSRDQLLEQMPEENKIAFDSKTKMMATIHKGGDSEYFYAVKGSPEAVLDACSFIASPSGEEKMDEDKKQGWLDRNKQIANRGLRVLALAKKSASNKNDDPYEDLTLLGLVGFMDPPREEVKPAIERCKTAGVRIIMATGDHGETAREVAEAVNLIEDDDAGYLLGSDLKEVDNLTDEERQEYLNTQIFARVDPEQKLDLIRLHQDAGAIVAMTGDGVNDAPALKKADIGIAMGKRGTQVAKEAADMVLQDDFFGTIVKAIEQGRTIFNNIRKFVLYLLSCNISEIMVVTIATVLSMPLPVLPLQILFLNLVTDVFPALALGMGEGDPQLMKEDPRDADEPIMTRSHWISTGVYGALITAAVLFGMDYALSNLGFSSEKSTTISFLILASAQLWHVFDMRENGTNPIINSVTKNKFVWFALVITIALLLTAVYVPFMADLLSLVNPGLNGWMLVLAASLLPMVISQIMKEFRFVN
jgi:Ca2+-transporting ATPase